jgi:malic enzyme
MPLSVSPPAPVIYTPTVGEACIAYGREFRRARGMFISSQDRGQMHSMIYNWPGDNVRHCLVDISTLLSACALVTVLTSATQLLASQIVVSRVGSICLGRCRCRY